MGGMASSATQSAPPTDTARGLPMATGFGGGSMTPQAAPPPQNPIGIGPPADMVRPTQPVPPVVQQMMQRQMPQFNPYNTGLQSLFSRFMAPQPMMRAPMQMPIYRPPALAYRPNLAAAQQNLSRVKPGVYKSDLDTARARIAELEARLAPPDGGSGG
jgi:hypothetical protein